MTHKILVTGGAGFIGSHLVDALVKDGHQVRVFDSLEPQVHGSLKQDQWPVYRNAQAEYILGDVRNILEFSAAIKGMDVIYHFAAATGVGQSMYQIAKYTAVNIQGTANLLDILANQKHEVEKLILSSSRAVYGEGLYKCPVCGLVMPEVRSPEQLQNQQWGLFCPNKHGNLEPLLTPETKTPAPLSIYAITKLVQEQLCTSFSRSYQMPVIVLRLFNVYGPRQALNNPYTGIISTFLQRLMKGNPPEVYEDGLMTRDMVFITDVIQGCLRCLEVTISGTYNIGSGQFTSILEIAQLLCQMICPDLQPVITGVARVGDIRHCSADLHRATSQLSFSPQVSLNMGLRQIYESVQGQSIEDQTSRAKDELKRAGMLK